MDSPGARNSSPARTVTSSLRERILTGSLPPGTALPQRSLAAEFGVSRIPVRDALLTLEIEGWVKSSSREGAVVAPMSPDDLQELYELRLALEPGLAAHGTTGLGAGDLAEMREWLALMRATTDPLAWRRANDEFHALIYRRTGRPRTTALVEDLRQKIQRYLHLHLTVVGDAERLDHEHETILAAVARGDGDAVAAATHEHLTTARDRILSHLLERRPHS